jgi:hypothetical protein
VSTDSANQELIPYNPAISIDNLVYIGDDGSDGCPLARDFVEGPVSPPGWLLPGCHLQNV